MSEVVAGEQLGEHEVQALAERFLGAWNSQVVDDVLACYTDDVIYRDPNTRGEVRGADALRRYLTKLFDRWQMHWELREGHALAGRSGAAVLWRASLRPADGSQSVEVDGMDLVVLDGERISRNEVYFDRAALAALPQE